MASCTEEAEEVTYFSYHECIVGRRDKGQGSIGGRQTSNFCWSSPGEHLLSLGPVESTETSVGFDASQWCIIQLVLPDFERSHMTC